MKVTFAVHTAVKIKGKLSIETKLFDDFSLRNDLISDEEIAIVEATINNSPMKRLGWKTPHDVMIEECSY